MIVQAASPEHFPWMTDRSGYVPLPDAVGEEAVSGGVIQGMVIFDGRTETMAQVHVALESPLAAGALRRVAFRSPFIQHGLRVLVTTLASDNGPAVRLALGMGFTEVGRVRDGFRVGVDLILYELRRDACRHLGV